MALNFPTSPELNQVYTSGTRSWRWDGSSWVANNSVTNILGYTPVNKAGDTMSGGLNVPNVNAVTVTANSGGFSIAGGSSASKTLTVSNSVTVSGTDGSTLNIGAGGTLQSGAFQVSSQGTTGAQGVQGTTGIQGSVGTQGTLGTQGSTGAQGTVGGAGIQGSTGSQGTGGAQGATGSQGAQGVQGTQGRTGAQGSTGTQGAVGSTGGTGATGSTGVQGTTGATGAQGTSGATILGSNNTWTGSNTFNGGLSSGSVITAATGASGGFQNAGYAGGRNRIWSFGNADAYGISYFQNVDSSDWIGMHFGNTTSYSNSQFYVSTGGNTWASTSSRAPIFYDSNDTAYYCDPASTSRLNAITYTNMYSSASSAYGFFGNNVYADTLNSGADSDPLELCYVRGAYSTTSGSMRAPPFYDRDNTGYYIDPNGTTNLAVTYGTQIYASDWFRPTGDCGVYFQSYSYGIWSSHSAGNGYGNVSTYGTGKNGWTGYGFASRLALMTDLNTGGSTFGLHDNSYGWVFRWIPDSYFSVDRGYSVFNSSARAPIFYDSNDTTYYVDPNSGGVSLRIAGAIQSNHTYWTGEMNKIQWHADHLYLQNVNGGYLLILRRADGSNMFHCDSAGNVTASGNVTAYSDRRLKENIETIPNALSLVQRLRGVTFDWIETKKHSYGVIAQEVEEVIPELVHESDDGAIEGDDKKIIKSVDYSKMVSVLIEAIKEQQLQIEELKALIKK